MSNQAAATAVGATIAIAALWIAASLFFLALYFLPILIAAMRHHPDLAAIALTNLLFGATVIGWCIALIWSAKHFTVVSVADEPDLPPGVRVINWQRDFDDDGWPL